MWLDPILQILILFIIYVLWKKCIWTQPKNFPRGPRSFPIIGHLPFLWSSPLETLEKWKCEYGKIVGLRFGHFNAVMLCDYNLIKDAFEMSEFSGRPKLGGPYLLVGGSARRGILTQDGPSWSEQRRFCLRSLRDFGFGKKSMEGMILEDASELLVFLRKQNGSPINPLRRVSIVVLSALWNIMAGEKLSHDDPLFQDVLDSLNTVFATSSFASSLNYLPWTAKVAPTLSGWTRFQRAVDKARDLLLGSIHKHVETYNENNLGDLMDVYIKEIRATENPNSSFYKNAGYENMLMSIGSLFGAGAETTGNSLTWTFYFLAKHTAIQRKLFEEIECIVGTSRLPNLDDKERMNYTEAVMLEVFRHSSVVPLGVFHNTTKDVEFHGHSIPKDTVVFSNIYSVHHDTDIWGDPEVFRPERFLTFDSNGLKIRKAGPLIPFSLGKRVCVGETLARLEFFLFLTSVVQAFEIVLDTRTPLLQETPSVPSIFRFPPPFKVAFKDRKHKP